MVLLVLLMFLSSVSSYVFLADLGSNRSSGVHDSYNDGERTRLRWWIAVGLVQRQSSHWWLQIWFSRSMVVLLFSCWFFMGLSYLSSSLLVWLVVEFWCDWVICLLLLCSTGFACRICGLGGGYRRSAASGGFPLTTHLLLLGLFDLARWGCSARLS